MTMTIIRIMLPLITAAVISAGALTGLLLRDHPDAVAARLSECPQITTERE